VLKCNVSIEEFLFLEGFKNIRLDFNVENQPDINILLIFSKEILIYNHGAGYDSMYNVVKLVICYNLL